MSIPRSSQEFSGNTTSGMTATDLVEDYERLSSRQGHPDGRGQVNGPTRPKVNPGIEPVVNEHPTSYLPLAHRQLTCQPRDLGYFLSAREVHLHLVSTSSHFSDHIHYLSHMGPFTPPTPVALAFLPPLFSFLHITRTSIEHLRTRLCPGARPEPSTRTATKESCATEASPLLPQAAPPPHPEP